MALTLGAGAEHFVTLEEVKAQANIRSTTDDDELSLFLSAAEEAVEGLVGPVRQRQVTEVVNGGPVTVLRYAPVVSVDAVTGYTTEALAGFTVDPEAGLLYGAPYGPVTVTYTVGRAVVPDSIRVAALIIAEHLWTTQRGSAPSVTLQGEDPVATPGMAYSIPNRATDLLRPYLLGPAVG